MSDDREHSEMYAPEFQKKKDELRQRMDEESKEALPGAKALAEASELLAGNSLNMTLGTAESAVPENADNFVFRMPMRMYDLRRVGAHDGPTDAVFDVSLSLDDMRDVIKSFSTLVDRYQKPK